MAEPIIERDLEFHFSHGAPLAVTVRDGRDAIEDIHPCPHCRRPGGIRITQRFEDGSETTHNIHAEKLNGTSSTKRIVQPTPEQELEAIVAAV